MKAIFLFFILILSAACHKEAPEVIASQQKIGPGNLTRHIIEKFSVGDINNDAVQDTAILFYDYIYSKDIARIQDKEGFIDLSFSKGIAPIRIKNSLDVFAQPTDDLNNDKANEMLLFSRTEGCWNNILVYSFLKGKWEILAQARCQFHGYPDNTDRITKEKDNFYLLGDRLDKTTGELMKRVVKIKIPTK